MTDQPSSAEIGSDEDIQRLLSLAGPRLQPPADVEARVRAATLAAVDSLPDRQPASRRWHKPALSLAAAAVFSLIAGLLIVPETQLPKAGDIVFASGAYTVRGSEPDDGRIAAGAIVRTSSSGRLLIDLGNQRTLRIDQDASLTLRDDSEIWLHRGRIYIDSAVSGSTTARLAVTVVTPYASVSDIGTQFEVAVDDESLVVATREGMVDVQLGSRDIRSSARPGVGEALKIDGLSLVSRELIPTVGSRWAWTQTARPLFSVKDRTYKEYLEWSARETGRTLKFRTPLAAQQAGLRTIGGTAPVDADDLARVLATSLIFEVLPGADHETFVGLREVD